MHVRALKQRHDRSQFILELVDTPRRMDLFNLCRVLYLGRSGRLLTPQNCTLTCLELNLDQYAQEVAQEHLNTNNVGYT